MQDWSIVPFTGTEDADYQSYYLTWFGVNCDDTLFGEPLSHAQFYDDSYSLTYEADDNPGQPPYKYGSAEQDSGTGTWSGDYESDLLGFWGEISREGRYEASSLGVGQYGNFMQPEYRENRWPCFLSSGLSEGGAEGYSHWEDQDRYQDLSLNTSRENSIDLYENIFSHLFTPADSE